MNFILRLNSSRWKYIEQLLCCELGFIFTDSAYEELPVRIYQHIEKNCFISLRPQKVISECILFSIRHTLDSFGILEQIEFGQKLTKATHVYLANQSGTHVICSNCGGTCIKIMADYSSSGLWCNECGVMVDYEDTLLPSSIVDKIKGWIDDYEHLSKHIETLIQGHNLKGFAIAGEIRKFHSCLLWIEK